MKIVRYPSRDQWEELSRRPQMDTAQLDATVRGVLDDVRQNGDEAVKRYEQQFDHVSLASLAVTQDEFDQAERLLADDLKDAICLAHGNIARFHEAQRFEGQPVETASGVVCWQKAVPIEKVGLYVPGGTAPLFSTVLMLATPARIAGCSEIVICTPPDRQGHVNPAVLFAARVAGVETVFKAGGVQAIGAMAYGTATIPKVYKIFGPGNQYVMAAKQQVSLHDVAIDMPAGPSEVCVIADASSNPAFVAADLLSQAEHGPDSQVMLITTSEQTLEDVQKEVERQLADLPRRDIAARSLENSRLVLVKDTDEAIALANCYAPEHLILATADCDRLAGMVVNAGSVFIGPWACESAGDYASGTNHTLPTHRHALAYSGVNLDSFQRKLTFQRLTPEGVRSIGPAVVAMAEGESLMGHANAMRLRVSKSNDSQ